MSHYEFDRMIGIGFYNQLQFNLDNHNNLLEWINHTGLIADHKMGNRSLQIL